MVAEHSRPQPGRLQDLGLPALGARVQEANTRFGRAEAAQRLVAVWADFNKPLLTIRQLTIGENDFGLVSRLKDNTLNSCCNLKCLHC